MYQNTLQQLLVELDKLSEHSDDRDDEFQGNLLAQKLVLISLLRALPGGVRDKTFEEVRELTARLGVRKAAATGSVRMNLLLQRLENIERSVLSGSGG